MQAKRMKRVDAVTICILEVVKGVKEEAPPKLEEKAVTIKDLPNLLWPTLSQSFLTTTLTTTPLEAKTMSELNTPSVMKSLPRKPKEPAAANAYQELVNLPPHIH